MVSHLEELMAKAVARLPYDCRTYVLSYYYEGKPIHEIQQELGMTEDEVTITASRSLQLLRNSEELKAWHEETEEETNWYKGVELSGLPR